MGNWVRQSKPRRQCSKVSHLAGKGLHLLLPRSQVLFTRVTIITNALCYRGKYTVLPSLTDCLAASKISTTSIFVASDDSTSSGAVPRTTAAR